jgi:cyclic beta-1,2-glucan synthetase
MKATPVRLVVAFYPSDGDQARRAYRALENIGHICLTGSREDKPAEFCRRLANLRLEGESMLAAETESSQVEAVVRTMRLSGTPAIFVMRPDLRPGKRWNLRAPHWPLAPSNGTRRAILAHLDDNQRELNIARADLLEAARLDHALTPAAEWILDNSYLIHTQITEVNRHLPRDYSGWTSAGSSPECETQNGINQNGINGLAHELVARTDFALNEGNIRETLRESQKQRPLSIAELWAFPLFLRIALVEALSRLATQVSAAQQLRELAYLWANRLAAAARVAGESFERILALLEAEPAARQAYFATALAEQLQDEEIALGPVQRWIEERFHKPLLELVREQHTREAGEVVSTANAFGSLRALSQIEFAEIFEQVSLVEAELRGDPGGIYTRSDFQTRDRCRRAVEKVSRYSGRAETEVARRAVELARREQDPRKAHVAWFLFAEGLETLEKETHARIPLGAALLRSVTHHPSAFYLTSITFITAAFTVLAGVLAWEGGVHRIPVLAALVALALFPLSELSLQIVNALAITLLPPEPLPKMNFEQTGIPDEHATLVVVPMMLVSHEVVRAELEKLEVRYLGNRDRNLFFSLFSDFMDSAEEKAAADESLYRAIHNGVEALNARYPDGHFLLFHRARSWSESEQSWIGRERKRGKLEELNAFLCAGETPSILRVGSLPLPIAYVITLDADTQLPLEIGRRLVETIAHPLNRVEIDPVKRVRKGGYTIIQPRVSITLPSATATRFTRIFADATGTDPYSRTVSDAQQDLFLDAIFHGKAIYDVQAFHAILGGRFPAERLLSHDLIEGAHVGVGLASDIELFEHLPIDYASYARRQHRWTRGDWQIAEWALDGVPAAGGGKESNPLSLINRWRILDNLRRSLVPVAALLMLLLGWLISAAPGVWSLVVGLAIAIPAVTPLLDRIARRMEGSVHRWQGASDEITRALVMLSFLPHQAWITVDAIVRVLYRRWVSRRNLLEWQTAEGARRELRRHGNATFRQLLMVSGLSAALTVILLLEGEFAPTSAFVVLWAISPLLMRWLATPGPTVERRLGLAETHMLRDIARHTWRFFDDLVGDSTNWLPPDNTQLALRVEVAERTSPTNIGMWFIAALSARDFGYITADDFERRLARTMETLDHLERYEGHLLNWYSTRTLEPLHPRYVSTVDSGNLIAALWVLEQGCRDILRAPVIGHAAIRGLSDTLSTLAEKAGDDPSSAGSLDALRRLLRGAKDGLQLISRLRLARSPVEKLREAQKWKPASGDDSLYWAGKLAAELAAWNETADRYLRWMDTLASPPDTTLRAIGPDAVTLRKRAVHHIPSLAALAGGTHHAVAAILAWRGARDLTPNVLDWLAQVEREYVACRDNAQAMVGRIETLATQAARIADGIKMGFLYDSQRRLFGVGYAVGGPREFGSHYDLLASECRLASLVSIAKGDVPAEHWQALYRPYAYVGKGEALLSWSGTMFEYLMPVIFTRTYANSLLERTCTGAVQRQIEHGEENRVPWGISESAFSAIDAHQIYQYRAFGVPELALNPAVENELVVAPYATVLALQVNAAAAAENLERLRGIGLAGPMGLYESIDFTRENTREGERGVVVYTYMAHHQGMSLAALNNVLHRDVIQRRFHSDLRVRAVESLLFERIPLVHMPRQEVQPRLAPLRVDVGEDIADHIWTEETTVPRINLHGNGRYTLMITNSGGGYSRWNQFDLTRWRSDATLDPWGSFIYLRDARSDELWSASHKPFPPREGESEVRFSGDRTELRRRVYGIETVLEVTVSSEDDVELRRISVVNRSLRTRHIELTSYLELAMAPHGADTAHPAFAKMFIETERPETGILLAHRRPRSPEDPPIWMGHALISAADAAAQGAIEAETDRARFLGRGNTPAAPASLRSRLSGSTGTVIDPIFSLRQRVSLDPRDRVELVFVTAAGSTREAVLDLLHKYLRPEAAGRAFEMAWTRAQLEFRFLGIGPGAAHRFLKLASQLLYPNPRLRPPADRLMRNRLGQQGLWGLGISGDLPIVLVTIAEARNLSLVREVLLAHAFWRLRGFRADLVILNQEAPGYDQPLRQQLLRHIEAHSSEAGTDKPGGVFVRDWYALSEESRNLLLATASIALGANRGPLQQQLAAATENLPLQPFVPAGTTHEEPSAPLPFLELPYFNGLGGFTADGREYAIYLKPGSVTPAPWVNVMASARFGAMVTESGLGFTWFGNSQSNRLTQWYNDPVSDPQAEIIYLRDEESGAIWTPTALPAREKDAYRARHGAGYTIFEHNSHAIGQELAVFVPIAGDGVGDPVKVSRLKLRNESSHTRRLTVTWFVEWVLGSNREDQQLHVQSSRDEESGALLARQYWSSAYPGQWAFAASSPRASSWSADRTQFFGRNMSRALPAGLEKTRLDNRAVTGADPGAALQVSVTLEPNQSTEVTFLLGQGESLEHVREIVARYDCPDKTAFIQQTSSEWWDSRLGALQVRTPVKSVDLLLNRWLLYQTLSCRFWGRSALYQSGGAFGFRDQLQDSLAFLYSAPQITRQHILLCASRQFLEGDVQHWWHRETGSGVRTRCSDDLLWLPFAVANYVRVSGDIGILQEEAAFIEGPLLNDGEQERMFVPTVSSNSAPLWEHCRRAIDFAWKLGPHQLPLMGNGDWNDGMNLVGAQGKGESVWLGWFLCTVMQDFAELVEGRAGENLAPEWRRKAAELKRQMEQVAWDGEWYLRAFFDDGTPLGSSANPEAKIDSLPQSWSVISGAGDAARSRQAMESAQHYLWRERERLVLLFTPPFDHSAPNPGYIMGYPPGLRENGGQYTHGALWMAMAWARLREGGHAVQLLQTMNPVELTRNPDDAARYKGEPYVVAADVYSAPGRVGQSGWTWYTGSAGWMYRVWIEEVLGLRVRGDRFTIDPVIPDDWPGFEMTWHYRWATYEIAVTRDSRAHTIRIEADGAAVDSGFVMLAGDGGVHKVTVRLPGKAGPIHPIQNVPVTVALDRENVAAG